MTRVGAGGRPREQGRGIGVVSHLPARHHPRSEAFVVSTRRTFSSRPTFSTRPAVATRSVVPTRLVASREGEPVKRLKIGLCLLSVASAAVLVVALPAGATPTTAASTGAASTGAASTGAAPSGAAPAAATAPLALVPARAQAPVATLKTGARGSVSPLANQDGACNSLSNGDGDFCYWFSTNFVGSLSDFFFSDANLGNNIFLTPGLGLGQPVANNSESALNADSFLSVLVFTGANFSGTAGIVQPRQFGNFNATFVNNVESHEFI